MMQRHGGRYNAMDHHEVLCVDVVVILMNVIRNHYSVKVIHGIHGMLQHLK